MIKRVLLTLGVLLGFIVTSTVYTTAPARAAAGNIGICTEDWSGPISTVRFNNNGSRDVPRGSCSGEVLGVTSQQPYYCCSTQEPLAFYIDRYTWYDWKVDGGPWAGARRTGATGIWVTVHPGQGFSGNWIVVLNHWV